MNRIQQTRRVRAGAPEWRSEHGETLAECVAHWLALQEDMGRFPLVQDAAPAIAAGQWCGVRARCDEGPAVSYLVTPAALTACIAGLGIACDTPADLHHVLFELVRGDYMRQEIEKHPLPGIRRRVALYCIDAAIMDGIHRPAAAARLVPAGDLQ